LELFQWRRTPKILGVAGLRAAGERRAGAAACGLGSRAAEWGTEDRVRFFFSWAGPDRGMASATSRHTGPSATELFDSSESESWLLTFIT
jgi:hypothetical protein